MNEPTDSPFRGQAEEHDFITFDEPDEQDADESDSDELKERYGKTSDEHSSL